MSDGPKRKPPASRSRIEPKTLGESMRGRHSHSTLPLGATSAVVSQSERKPYSAIGGNGDVPNAWLAAGPRGPVLPSRDIAAPNAGRQSCMRQAHPPVPRMGGTIRLPIRQVRHEPSRRLLRYDQQDVGARRLAAGRSEPRCLRDDYVAHAGALDGSGSTYPDTERGSDSGGERIGCAV